MLVLIEEGLKKVKNLPSGTSVWAPARKTVIA